jgi:Zn-dependent alcohol dehydrogenase
VETFPFDQINEAAARAKSGEVVKPVLRVGT